jgi:hypothetical protein
MGENKMKTKVGTCSICGGQVSVPTYWHCVFPPIPICECCGATAASHGKIIPMIPNKIRITNSDSTQRIKSDKPLDQYYNRNYIDSVPSYTYYIIGNSVK